MFQQKIGKKISGWLVGWLRLVIQVSAQKGKIGTWTMTLRSKSYNNLDWGWTQQNIPSITQR